MHFGRFPLLALALGMTAVAQQPAPPKPAPGAKPAAAKPAAAKPAVKPAPAKAAPKGNPQVDTVIELVRGGMSEDMILQILRKEAKPHSLTTQDLLKLQRAGISETVVKVLMDPNAAVAAAPPATPPPAAAPPVDTAPPPPAAKLAAAEAKPAAPPRKRVLAVNAFDYGAVKSAVMFWFKTDVNIGQGIRAMLTDRLNRAGQIRLVEREKVEQLMKEQDFGASNRVKRGSQARIGQIVGADAMLYGDIVIFGRDDTQKGTSLGGAVFRRFGGGWASLNKEEKAVVAINFRIVDSETSEVIETGEARGESSRKSKNWGAVLGTTEGAGGAGATMQSSNFENTIIGEATKAAVDKLAEELNGRIAKLPMKQMEIEGRVAQFMPDGTIYLNVGSNDGVVATDRFEIHQIVDMVMDPVTKEVLDQRTVKVGEMTIRSVREKVTVGSYVGTALNMTAKHGYAARRVQ